MSATKGAEEDWQMLTFADKGGGGVWQIADITDQNALKEPKNIFIKFISMLSRCAGLAYSP